MGRRGTRAHLARAQTTMDLELPSPSPRSAVELLQNRDQPSPAAHATDWEYVPPNGGYGWVCVVCVFFINAHTWGINFVSWPLSITYGSNWTEILNCRLHVGFHGTDLISQ